LEQIFIVRLKKNLSQFRLIPNPRVDLPAAASVQIVQHLLGRNTGNGGRYQKKTISTMLSNLIFYRRKVCFGHSRTAGSVVLTADQPVEFLSRETSDENLGKQQVSSAIGTAP
jgi:hypothetical protein